MEGNGLSQPSTIDVGPGPTSLLAQDLDGDGDGDLAVLLNGPGSVEVLLQTAARVFVATGSSRGRAQSALDCGGGLRRGRHGRPGHRQLQPDGGKRIHPARAGRGRIRQSPQPRRRPGPRSHCGRQDRRRWSHRSGRGPEWDPTRGRPPFRRGTARSASRLPFRSTSSSSTWTWRTSIPTATWTSSVGHRAGRGRQREPRRRRREASESRSTCPWGRTPPCRSRWTSTAIRSWTSWSPRARGFTCSAGKETGRFKQARSSSESRTLWLPSRQWTSTTIEPRISSRPGATARSLSSGTCPDEGS